MKHYLNQRKIKKEKYAVLVNENKIYGYDNKIKKTKHRF